MTAFTLRETAWSHDAAGLSAVRRAVFIEEQGVPEALEWDEHDASALHALVLTIEGMPIGCARLLPDGQIGRMAVLPAWRGHGIGQALLDAMQDAARRRGVRLLKLSAQMHAVPFYAAAGFVAEGAAYEEAGVLHRAMHKSLS